MDAAALEELEHRLALAEDRLAILELEGAYARAFDERRGADWAALFTTGGTYESRATPPSSGPPAVQAKGPAALAAFCEGSAFSGIHLPSVPQVTFDGDRATARVHFTFHAAHASARLEGTLATTVGYYDVAYERTPDGWRIARRVTTGFARSRTAAVGYHPRGAFDAAEDGG